MTDRQSSNLERSVLTYIRTELPGLADHFIGTRDFALEINCDQSLGLDEEKIVIASLCHDLARLIPADKIKSELTGRGIDPESFGFVQPILLHTVLSAELAKELFGIHDDEILTAIRNHGPGARNMSLLDKLIYVADKIEVNRDYHVVKELRVLVRQDFHKAFPRVIGAVITYLVAEQRPVDYNSVAAYNQAIMDISR
jgi:predicted HD superfamily hydrolase involved in NAD metabolism